MHEIDRFLLLRAVVVLWPHADAKQRSFLGRFASVLSASFCWISGFVRHGSTLSSLRGQVFYMERTLYIES